MRTYVSPIGYNSTSVVRPVLSRGLDSGDEILLLRPRTEADDQRAEEAIADVERLLTEIEPDVSLSVERLPHDDFADAVLECSDLITGIDGDVVVNFAGGPRDVLVPLTTAALAHTENIAAALSFSDIDGSVRDVPLPVLTSELPKQAKPTFLTISKADDRVSIPTITDDTGLSKSSVTRHVQMLETAGLVRTEKHGKTKIVELTFSGRLRGKLLEVDD